MSNKNKLILNNGKWVNKNKLKKIHEHYSVFESWIFYKTDKKNIIVKYSNVTSCVYRELNEFDHKILSNKRKFNLKDEF